MIPPVDDDATGRKNMQQLIQLRWIAVLGQVGTILVVYFVFKIELPLLSMFAVLAGLVAFNGASLLRLRLRRPVSNGELFVALLVDVVTLTMQLYLSGGATNPFIFLYLLQVVLAAVLLEAWSTWLNAVLLVIFINRITRNRRDRDARLAALRQRAAEEEHIVRMGLLASGAAHELGTPLATLAVILGDWRRMPVFRSDPDLAQEIGEMQTQVLRCKSIVSGILLSAGEARGEASEETTVHAFVDELVAEWRSTRPVNDFEYRNLFGEDRAIISDSALKQTVHNVLDNALEASTHWVGLEVSRRDDTLIVSVTDQGAGFSEAMLNHLGRPYQSTKGRPGGGLGLFLVFNVVRTLGGNVSAGNRPQGGAVVTLTLPLSALTIDDQEMDEQEMDEQGADEQEMHALTQEEGGHDH